MTPERELLERLRRVVAEADVDAEAVVEEAWREARAEVRDSLRRLLSHDLLERCLRVLADEAPAATRASPPRDRPGGDAAWDERPGGDAPEPTPASASDPGLAHAAGEGSTGATGDPPAEARLTYVFGIVPGDVDPETSELAPPPGGGALRTVPGPGLRAVVCDVDPGTFEVLRTPGPEGLDTLAAAAHAHDGALAALARATTVLPLRLGTALPDDGAVRRLLHEHATRLRAELDRVAGHAEWAVTVQVFEDGVADDAARRAGSGGDYLRLRQAALDERATRFERRQRLAAELHERLAATAVAADTVSSRPVDDVAPPLLHGVYLLPDAAVAQLERVVAALREEQPGAVIEVSGPWPPYHFTSIDLTPPEDVQP